MKTQRYRFLRGQGFSLLEVLTGMAITATIMAISVPLSSRLKTLKLLRLEAYKVKSILEEVGVIAHQQREELRVKISGTSIRTTNRHNIELRANSLRAPIKFGGTKTIVFYNSGVVSPVTLKLRSDNSECMIKISLRGRVRTIC